MAMYDGEEYDGAADVEFYAKSHTEWARVNVGDSLFVFEVKRGQALVTINASALDGQHVWTDLPISIGNMREFGERLMHLADWAESKVDDE